MILRCRKDYIDSKGNLLFKSGEYYKVSLSKNLSNDELISIFYNDTHMLVMDKVELFISNRQYYGDYFVNLETHRDEQIEKLDF